MRSGADAAAAEPGGTTSLGELARLFLRLGTTSFGGPAAHTALMHDEVVARRRWLTDPEFLDLVGATNLIPGPNSTELAIHIGWGRRRWAGLAVAGVCFIAPAMLLTGALAWAYVRYGALPEARALLYGIKPVIVAVVVQALWVLARTAVKGTLLAFVAACALAAVLAGAHELVVLAAAGVLVASVRVWPARRAAGFGLLAAAPALPATLAAGTAYSGTMLFFSFAKIGAVLFGSGYVLLAFLRTEFVERLHWISETQLLDAVAAGQMTPGPVFSSATFVGYLVDGVSGALLATAGIFLPAFVFVAASGFLVPRLRRSPGAGAFLDGVNVASLALMAVALGELAGDALVDVPAILLACASAVLLVRWKFDPTWLIAAGACIGLALHALR
jgi:chromate transporter